MDGRQRHCRLLPWDAGTWLWSATPACHPLARARRTRLPTPPPLAEASVRARPLDAPAGRPEGGSAAPRARLPPGAALLSGGVATSEVALVGANYFLPFPAGAELSTLSRWI